MRPTTRESRRVLIPPIVIFVAGIYFLRASAGFGAESKSEETPIYEPKPLDGVSIEALETYLNPKTSELGLGVGLFPFNAYYYGFNLYGNYTIHLDQTLAWEIFNGSYVYPFQKGLTAELADRYNVEPEAIEKLRFVVTTNLFYTIANGKFVFMKDQIRYFRSTVFLGAGIVNSTQRNSLAVSFGTRFEIFFSRTFSWRFEVRDAFSISGLDNFITFNLGSGIHF